MSPQTVVDSSLVAALYSAIAEQGAELQRLTERLAELERHRIEAGRWEMIRIMLRAGGYRI